MNARPDPNARPEPGGCFVAGTKVWTDKGLVSIEKIKIGDMVLSQPDSQGEKTYKRVIDTMVFDDKEIRSISYYIAPEAPNLYADTYELRVTGNHPFWVAGKGWTSADLLQEYDVLELADGRLAKVGFNLPVYRTDEPDVGWVPQGNVASEYDVWNFRTGELIGLNVEGAAADWDDIEGAWGYPEDPYLKTLVYNLEVEDFHTYYVHNSGVWVHNQGCIELWDASLYGPQVVAPRAAPRFATNAELNAAIRNRDPQLVGVEYVLVKSKGAVRQSEQAALSWPKSLVFEDGVVGRVHLDQVRYEEAPGQVLNSYFFSAES